MSEPEYRQLDDISHMLAVPERDLGDCTIHMVDRYMLDMNSMKLLYSTIPYSSAIERLFLEILYNAADNVEKSRLEGIDPGSISVSMTKDTITIRNGGRPISCQKQPNDTVHIPELIFGRLLTGSSFMDENKSRKVATIGGRFGIGAKATNIFSLYFSVKIGNAKEKVHYHQIWKSNMRVCQAPIITRDYEGASFTEITFMIDFARFYDEDNQYGFSGQRTYNANMLMAFAKHCADVSMTAQVDVLFNKRKISCTDILRYASLYFPSMANHLVFKSKDSICIIVDTPDDGHTVSFVNSVINDEGGIHIDHWRKALFTPLIKHVKHKMRGIKITLKDIVKHISMILICRLPNPKYKAQTKDKVTSPAPTINTNGIDLSILTTWSGYQCLERLLRLQIDATAKKTDGKKRSIVDCPKLIDAPEAGGKNSIYCTFIVTEGDSASTVVAKSMGDKYLGTLPIKGKMLNVGKAKESLDANKNKYVKNSEIYEIKQALGLKEGTDYSSESARTQLRYGKMIILSDQDVDGAHIRMLVINFFRWKFPSLLTCGYIQIMETPLLRLTYDRQILKFYYQKEYDDWLNEAHISDVERTRRKAIKPERYKGLGSSTDEQIIDFFNNKKILVPEWDKKADELMSIAFDNDMEDERKDWVLSWDPVKGEGKYASLFPSNTISHLVTNQLCEFSYMNVQRSLPSLVDGLKQCQRKVLTVMFDIATKKKVSQLKGLISDKMDYQHGDDALYRTIVGMGNYCVGTNNLPLIKGIGQYDSRLHRKAAADRYIYACKSPILKYLFRTEDKCILEYLYEGDHKIEPKVYYPIIPPWAVNRLEAIGTGWSTKIACYNPIDIIKYIVWLIKIVTQQITSVPGGITIGDKAIPFEAPPELKPYYHNYQGEIKKIGNDWYSVGAYEEIKSKKHLKDILITEIPVTQTIRTYASKLDKLKEKPMYKVWTGKGEAPKWIGNYKLSLKKMEYKVKNEKYIEVLPYITIEAPLCAYNNEGGPLRALGLIEKISDTNIVLLNADGKPMQYGGAKEIIRSDDKELYVKSGVTKALDEFFKIRYNAYKRRRIIMMDEWDNKIQHLRLKQQFINDVVSKKITLEGENSKRKSKAILVQQIKHLGYPPEFGDISVYMLTDDGIDTIEREISTFQIKYDNYKKKSAASIWMDELKELYEHL